MVSHRFIQRISLVYLSVAAIPRLIYEFSRLLWQSGDTAAIDLRQRYEEAHLWFSGTSVYEHLYSAVYPPASYVMMWPFLMFPSLTLSKWVWGVSTLGALIWLIYLLVRESGVETTIERALIILLPLAMYSSTITIGNGQITIHVIALLVAGLTRLRQMQVWPGQVLTILFLVFALVKPTLSVPFFLIVLFLPGGLWRLFLVSGGYGLLALLATGYQPGNLWSLHFAWLQRGVEGAAWGSEGGGADQQTADLGDLGDVSFSPDLGYNDLHSFLGALGLEQWNMPASLGLLFILGVWIFLHRSIQIWLLIGVTAIITRIFVYHRVYDDMLILLALIPLIQIIKTSTSRPLQGISTGILFLVGFASTVPSSLRLLPHPQDLIFKRGQLIVWSILLVFLLYTSWQERILNLPSSDLDSSDSLSFPS